MQIKVPFSLLIETHQQGKIGGMGNSWCPSNLQQKKIAEGKKGSLYKLTNIILWQDCTNGFDPDQFFTFFFHGDTPSILPCSPLITSHVSGGSGNIIVPVCLSVFFYVGEGGKQTNKISWLTDLLMFEEKKIKKGNVSN